MGVNYYNGGWLYRLSASQNFRKTDSSAVNNEIISIFFRVLFFEKMTSSILEKFSHFGKIIFDLANKTSVSSNKSPFSSTIFSGTLRA